MLRTILAATLLLLAGIAFLPAPAAAATCASVSLGDDNSAGACLDKDSVEVYRCTFVNCLVLRVPIPPVTG